MKLTTEIVSKFQITIAIDIVSVFTTTRSLAAKQLHTHYVTESIQAMYHKH